MKTYLTAAATALLLLSSNNAYATQEWRGAGYVTFENQPCVTGGAIGAVGQSGFYKVRYRPPNISNNGASTRLVFYERFGTQSYKLSSGNLTNSYQNVEGGVIFSQTSFFSNQASMKVFLQKPIVVALNTPSIRLRGKIRNFSDTLNCRVLFDVSVTRRP